MAEGHSYESAVSTLFLIRGTDKLFNFELANNMESIGGKFDDVIFRYKIDGSKDWRYRYLQAKHKTDEGEKIRNSKLVDDKGDFSLAKYFRSYCRMIDRGEDVHDCTIFTNIGFDVEDLNKVGIDLEEIKTSGDILDFSNTNLKSGKKPASYKLKPREQSELRKQLLANSNDKMLAMKLHELATTNKTTDLRNEILQAYHVSLKEVIDVTSKKFNPYFVIGTNLIAGAVTTLRENLTLQTGTDWKSWTFNLNNTFGQTKSTFLNVTNPLPTAATDVEIDGFFDKLVFVVNSPNATEMEKEVLPADFREYYKENCLAQTARVIKYVTEWINKKDGSWLSTINGKKQLLSGVTDVSDDYLKQLEMDVWFNTNAIQNMAEKLKSLILLNLSSYDKKVFRIATPSPKYTAAKVIAAIQTQSECRYLVTLSSCLQNKDDNQRWENILKLLETNVHQFLFVVCQDDDPIIQQEELASLLPNDVTNSKVILIGGEYGEIVDDINYNDFDINLQETILFKTVTFQGKKQTVRELIPLGKEPGNVIDWLSIKELIIDGKDIDIPSLNTTRFHKSLYIKRRIIKGQYGSHFHDELAKSLECSIQGLENECKVNSNGNIWWQVTEDRKKEILQKIKMILEKNNSIEKSSSMRSISEDELINEDNWRRRAIIIISGVAGTGKSTVLSHYYTQIKEANPDWWTIKINLSDYSSYWEKFDIFDTSMAIDFLVSLPGVVGQSLFARSLLKHRLQTGDRVVLMLDGFDEINSQCQKAVIQFMKVFTEMKNSSVRLYVTTRPHASDDLQLQLSQLAFTLDNFSLEDQINYLTLYWKMTIKDNLEETDLRKCACDLVQQVRQTLEDEENNFIGIPLQCWILAECFQRKVQNVLQSVNEEHKFDLTSLYEQLMRRKEQVFIKERLKLYSYYEDGDQETAGGHKKTEDKDDLVSLFVQETLKNIKFHLRKLAMETIFSKQEDLKMLLPSCPLVFLSDNDRDKGKDRLDKLSNSYGLTNTNGQGKLEFLHRTFAEFLVAEYIYQGFHLDGDRHNKLLEEEPSRKFIINDVLMKCKYDGVRIFLDSMLKKLIESQKWRDVIDTRPNIDKPIPNRYQQIACMIELQNRVQYGFLDDAALYFGAQKEMNIFHFLVDCLDATFTKTSVRKLVGHLLTTHSWDFMTCNSRVIERFFQYYEDASEDELKEVLWGILENTFFSFANYLPKCSSASRKEEIKKVSSYIRLMEHQNIKVLETVIHLKNSDQTLNVKVVRMLSNFFKFFILNEYYGRDFTKFSELLVGICASDVSAFVCILKYAIIACSRIKEFWNIDKLEKLLLFTCKLGPRIEKIRYKIFIMKVLEEKEIAQLILGMDVHLFKKVYKPERTRIYDVPKDIETLLERDTYGMTRIHKAILNDQADVVDEALLVFRECLTDEFQKEKVMNFLLPIMSCNPYQEYLTPFYVATMCAKKTMLSKLIRFLETNRLLETDSKKEFLYSALQDVNLLRKTDKMQLLDLILASFKEILGQADLINYVMVNWEWDQNSFQHFVKIVITRYGRCNGYEYFGDLLTNNPIFNNLVLEFANDEVFQKILSTVTETRFNSWINKCYSDEKKVKLFGFKHANCYSSKMNENQWQQFLRIITSPTTMKSGRKTTYWAEWFLSDPHYDDISTNCNKLCEWTNNLPGQMNLKNQLLYDGSTQVSIIVQAVLDGKMKCVQVALSYLPTEEDEDELIDHLRENAPRLIKENYLSIDADVYCHISTLQFYLEHASSEQLKSFVQEMTFRRGKNDCICCNLICRRYEISWPFENFVKPFMKALSKKLDTSAVNHIVLHKHPPDGDSIAFAEIWFWNEDALSDAYSHIERNDDRNELCHKLFVAASESNRFRQMLISSNDELFRWIKSYLGIESRRMAFNLFDWFTVLIAYFIEKLNKDQLINFVKLITMTGTVRFIDGVRVSTNQSVWADYLVEACEETVTVCDRIGNALKPIQKFLQIVTEKLSQDELKNLVFHENNNEKLIYLVASTGNIRLFKVLIAQFDNENQLQIIVETFKRLSVIERIWNLMGATTKQRVQFLLQNFLRIDSRVMAADLAIGFNLSIQFLEKFNRMELSSFIDYILSVKRIENGKNQFHYSIWKEYINTAFAKAIDGEIPWNLYQQAALVKSFLKCVKEKVSYELLKELLNVNIEKRGFKINHLTGIFYMIGDSDWLR